MASDIYLNMFNRKIENFVKVFSNDSNSIFKKSDNSLLHPGEYGKYRERACIELLKFILKKDVDISDGFVITSKNSVSTQCDIIIYNSQTIKIISGGIARMFPIEEVRGIGEIKSNLNKTEFKNALIKLAKNKMLQDERIEVLAKKKFDDKTYNTIPTFLICNKLEFDLFKVDFKELYGDIPKKYWHNVILSIEDGFISYLLDFKKGNEKTIKILKENKFNLETVGIWPIPYKCFNDDIIENDDNIVLPDNNNKYNHIIQFCVNLANLISEVYIYEHDPIEYFGFNTDSPFLDD